LNDEIENKFRKIAIKLKSVVSKLKYKNNFIFNLRVKLKNKHQFSKKTKNSKRTMTKIDIKIKNIVVIKG
jgi:hypothetical protein